MLENFTNVFFDFSFFLNFEDVFAIRYSFIK